jgi:hypothetical protein
LIVIGMKLAGWVDIGRNLLCGFALRREYRKMQEHGGLRERNTRADDSY